MCHFIAVTYWSILSGGSHTVHRYSFGSSRDCLSFQTLALLQMHSLTVPHPYWQFILIWGSLLAARIHGLVVRCVLIQGRQTLLCLIQTHKYPLACMRDPQSLPACLANTWLTLWNFCSLVRFRHQNDLVWFRKRCLRGHKPPLVTVPQSGHELWVQVAGTFKHL